MKHLIISIGILMTGIFTYSCINPICVKPDEPPAAETSWEELSSAVPGDFIGLHFVTDNIGYIGGVGGVMAKTVDGGKNFTAVNTGTSNSIYIVHFSDASNGILAGDGVLKRTTDGGATWNNISFPGPGFRNSFFLTPLHGWLCGGSGTLIETTDGGATWNTLNTCVTETIYGVHFVNANVGYAAGSSQTALKTIDGGVTWNQMNIPGGIMLNHDFLTLYFVNEEVGYLSGIYVNSDQGYLMKTTDGGDTWTEITFPRAGTTLYGIAATGPNDIYFSGGTISSGSPLLVKTEDGGSSWKVMNDTIAGRLCRMQIINNTLYSVGFNTSIIKGSNL